MCANKQNESWGKRWLRADKVTKVLATAKLANKMRSKIKEKQKTKLANEAATAAATPIVPEPPKVDVSSEMPANIVVGSVEHYKELTKQK